MEGNVVNVARAARVVAGRRVQGQRGASSPGRKYPFHIDLMPVEGTCPRPARQTHCCSGVWGVACGEVIGRRGWPAEREAAEGWLTRGVL